MRGSTGRGLGWALGATSWLWVASGCWLADDGDGDTSATSAGTTGTPECTTECSADLCQRLVCSDQNVCQAENLPAGSQDDDNFGDCQALLCDGAGGYSLVVDVEDPPWNPYGDCQKAVCDGAGGSFIDVDESDTPNDGLECTVDSCDHMTPLYTPKPVNSACEGSSFCHADGSCQRCAELVECTDPGPEPNDSQSMATQLGTISDNDADGGFVCAALASPTDVDWYMFSGVDKLGNAVDPTRTMIATSQGRLCVYARCVGTGTTVSCFQGTKDTAPQGQNGCCGQGTIAPYVNCDGLDDSMTVWIKVENQNGLECLPYELDYHF